METTYRITLHYACGGIIADQRDVVVVAAPIFKWMLGKTMSEVRKWLLSKSGSIEAVKS
jgi:hypothetical protein